MLWSQSWQGKKSDAPLFFLRTNPHVFTKTGIVDVPFLLGSTGHEGDCCTPLDLRNASVSEWTALLARQFLPWGAGPALGERIAGVCRWREVECDVCLVCRLPSYTGGDQADIVVHGTHSSISPR